MVVLRCFHTFLSLIGLFSWAAALPAPEPSPAIELVGGLLDGLLGAAQSEYNAISSRYKSAITADATAFFSAYAAIITAGTVSHTPAPTATAQFSSLVSDIFAPAQTNDVQHVNVIITAIELVANGINPDYNNGITGAADGSTQSFNNRNKQPPKAVYPKVSSADAPYDVSETVLRSAIYIPSSFTYGKKIPVILFPGTGATGGSSFAGNMIPLMQADSRFDPVWVNVPGYMLDDAQTNAEFAAYAMNYIAAVCNRKVAVVSWSQGSLSTQWALKYWPSTRSVMTDHIPVSPDYRGTVNAYFLCPWWPLMGCDPSINQQAYNSTFVATLRRNDGDSAYVPTTTIYSSIFDEIVEPQTGTSASGYLKDARGVGVSNNEVQAICPGQPGGSFYTHELALANPVTWGLVVDALTNDGPGQISRLDINGLCGLYLAQGLSVNDGIATQAVDVQAALTLLLYPNKSYDEPPIKSYATY